MTASNFSLQHQGLQIIFLTLGRRLNAEDSMPPFRAQCANYWISKRVGSGRNNSNKSSSSSSTVSNITVMWTSKRLVNQAVKRKTQTTRFTYSLVCWKVCSLKWDSRICYNQLHNRLTLCRSKRYRRHCLLFFLCNPNWVWVWLICVNSWHVFG